MVNQIELGGKVRPILFGNYVFRKMKTEKNKPLPEILKGIETFEAMDFDILSNLVYYAIRAGELATNLPAEEFTTDQVSIWMDTEPGVLLKVLPYVSESITSMVTDKDSAAPSGSEADDAKKKN
jgi:hypothetical protein